MKDQKPYPWMVGLSVAALFACAIWTYSPSAAHYEKQQYDTIIVRRYPIYQISEYDALFKEYADTLQWNWKWLAAVAYMESRFNPEVVSSQGAVGLMQIMPQTAMAMGIDSLHRTDPRSSVEAATYLFCRLNNRFCEVPMPDRVCFVLAAYNAGSGHVLDAIRLTKKYGGNNHRWQGQVEYYLGRKSDPAFYTDTVCHNGRCSGLETIAFVRNVKEKYDEYTQLEMLYNKVYHPDTVLVRKRKIKTEYR